MRFQNEIIKSGRLDRFGQPVTGNADQTLHQGIELTAAVDPAPDLRLEGNVTVSRNRLVSYAEYQGSALVRLDGNTIAGFPEFLANARATYRWKWLSASLAFQRVGEFFTDNYQNPRSGGTDAERTVDAYSVIHAWVNVEVPTEPFGQSVEARLQVNNLFNAIYASHGEGDQFFPASERNIFVSLQVRL
jgi:iron complex outermembrane receptor protein